MRKVPVQRPDARKHPPDADSRLRALVLVPAPSSRGATKSAANSGGQPGKRSAARHDPSERLQEAIGLAEAIGLQISNGQIVPLPRIRPGALFGGGKVDELALTIETEEIDLVIIDFAVSPVQQRNLEKAWNCKVLDRTGLILEIFGARARTKEGRLQVELAHLTYQKGRLVRSWTHLERQRGGAGFLGGPGERQIELDRRMIGTRIDAITKELQVVVRTRALHRAGRRRVPYPVVALVGYTNAGKSTLFNKLTGAGVLAQDQVFATLDPTMREVALPGNRRIILSDTVGFISDLPLMLVAAFRATLEEVIEADIVLHLRDISHPQSKAQAADVEGVMKALGVDPDNADSPIIEVWNKIDLLAAPAREEIENAAARAGQPPVLLSAVSGEGIDLLLTAIDARLGQTDELLTVAMPANAGALAHWLHENTTVLSRDIDTDGTLTVTLRLPKDKRGRFEARLKAAGIVPPAP